jgi:hypothetical protein
VVLVRDADKVGKCALVVNRDNHEHALPALDADTLPNDWHIHALLGCRETRRSFLEEVEAIEDGGQDLATRPAACRTARGRMVHAGLLSSFYERHGASVASFDY